MLRVIIQEIFLNLVFKSGRLFEMYYKEEA